MSEEDRFLSKIQPEPMSGCWLWNGTYSNCGYGTIRVGSLTDGSRRNVLAHRFSVEMFHGAIPEKMLALHKCDVKACVNPAHLYIGTPKDNGRDASERGFTGGRPLHGESNGNSRLRELQVREILRSPESLRVMATRFGVSKAQISCIRSGKSWGHLNAA